MEIQPWYVTGLVDGEGSFLVSFSRREKISVGVEARPSFSLSQHKRNEPILETVQKFFGCGSVRFDSHDQTYKFEVRCLKDLIDKIVPHFERYPLQTSKNNDFEALKAIITLMKSNWHRKSEGIKEIIKRAYRMNNLGARRYRKEDLLKFVER